MEFNWITFVVSFLVGAGVTAGVVYLRVRFLYRNILKRQKKEVDTMKEVHGKVAAKLKKVKNIIDRQQELADVIIKPGPIHGLDGATADKYELIQEHEDLEKDKITILNEVVYKDGIDTEVTVMNPDTKVAEVMKLSEYLKYLEKQHKRVEDALKESTVKKEVDNILSKLKSAKSKTYQDYDKPKHKVVKKETDRGTFYMVEKDDDDDGEGTIH